MIPDDIMDAAITEHISVLLGADDVSGPLHSPASGGNTVPDPPLADDTVLELSDSTAEARFQQHSRQLRNPSGRPLQWP